MISIVIPVLNGMKTLPKVFRGLSAQTTPAAEIEVMLVDDGSTDGTQEFVHRFMHVPQFKILFFCQSTQGAAAARNVALRHAGGSVILFLDADIIPTPELVAEHLKFHAQHPDIHDAVRGRSLVSPELDLSQQVTLDQTELLATSAGPTRIPWTDFVTNNISVKKAMLDKYHCYFDEQMLRNEDVELGFRLTRKGLRLFFNPQALGYHYHPLNLAQHIQRAKIHSRSYAIWFRKMPELKNILTEMGLDSNYCFVTKASAFSKVVKHYLKCVLINAVSVRLLAETGQRLLATHGNLARYLIHLVYQYYFRTNLQKESRRLEMAG